LKQEWERSQICMLDQPKVSVTVPSYNHARFLPATIESLLAQTYQNLEIIIVDDGSTDDSLQIAEQYAARHPDLIQVVTHPGHNNRGISATVNLGFQLATGPYWCGLPSDDLLHPLKIAEQVAFLERHPEFGWVYCYAYYIDEDGKSRPEFGLFGDDVTALPGPVERLIHNNVIPGMTVLMRRAVVAQIEPHDETLIYSDWDFWVRLAARHRVAFQPRVRVRYRLHSGNTSVGIKQAINADRAIKVMEKLQRAAITSGSALARSRVRALIELQLTYYFHRADNEYEAQKHLAAAFVLDPSLRDDVRYFVRWLKHCHRDLVLLHDRPHKTDFVPWVLARLVEDSDRDFAQEVERAVKGRTFRPGTESYYRMESYLRGRRKLMVSFFRDPRAWIDPDLLVMYVTALIGSRLSRWLRLRPNTGTEDSSA